MIEYYLITFYDVLSSKQTLPLRTKLACKTETIQNDKLKQFKTNKFSVLGGYL